MPELPEVETIATDLRKELSGRKIRSFELLNQKAGLRHEIINLPMPEFRHLVIGNKIERVFRRAKNIVIDIGAGVIAIHLKMTGQLIYENRKKHEVFVGGHPILNVGRELPNKFSRAVFGLSDGGKLYFNDVRRFGWLRYYTQAEWSIESARAGIEPLSDSFTLTAFTSIIGRKARVTAKQAILEQKLLAGVGNIYADEALFMAKIRPQRQAGSLTPAEIKALWQAIPKILKSSIKHRGTSFNDYVDAKGSRGNFVRLLKVYGRKDQPCKICGRPIQKTRIGGRGTHWCDHCQR